MSQASRRVFVPGILAVLAVLPACRRAAVETGGELPLRRVVVYRNGVGYFERRGHVRGSEVRFRVAQREVGDFLATLAVMERGGSSVRAAAFPIPGDSPLEEAGDGGHILEQRRTVRLSLDGRDHDLVVGYSVETPIWRPSYRLVMHAGNVQVQAWGIVENVSGEDWTDVRFSLVAGAPVSFRSELATPVVPVRPEVTDQGTVIDAVPTTETTLAQEAPGSAQAAQTAVQNRGIFAALAAPGGGAAAAQPDTTGTGWGGGGTGEGSIGLGNVGTMGHGAGTGTGQGYGSGAGRGLRSRGTTGPTVLAAPPSVAGLLSPEAIRRVVLRNLGQVTHCYEQGLATDPNMAGRVVVRFVIGGTGTVVGSNVADSSVPMPSVGECMANALRRWHFPAPEGGGIVTVNYPFNMQPADEEEGGLAAPEPAPSATPRNVRALAGLAVQGGATRYDLPDPVTVPDHSATMVMLAARDVPGQQMYLFAPDPGVADSSSHPFHVARFENRTGAMLERGPVAIFEDGAFLGEGMLEALPDGAIATVPFALERALAVESSATTAVEGARLLTMHGDTLTIERYNVSRTTYRVRNGMSASARVMMRQALDGAEVYQPPPGTEQANGSALVPIDVGARAHGEVLVTTRSAYATPADLTSDEASEAITQYLHDAHPVEAVATGLQTALDLRRQIEDLTHERSNIEQQRNDLRESSDETRQNLEAIQHNPQAADLRAQLSARLARAATQLDQATRRAVELDTQVGERRVRLAETVRDIDVDVSHTATPAS